MFAARLALVEGVTDAALLREFGRIWAGGDLDKQAFVDALSIVPMGTRVGAWPVRLLATQGYEIAEAVAVLRDSDRDFADQPLPPSWSADHDPSVVQVFHSHPTLEPAITEGNEDLVAAAVAAIDLDAPDPVTPETVHDMFKSGRKETSLRPATPAGPEPAEKGSSRWPSLSGSRKPTQRRSTCPHTSPSCSTSSTPRHG